MEMHRRFEYDITPIEAMQTTLLTECGIRMDVNLNSYTNYNTQVDWHPIKTHNDHRKIYMHLAEKADDLFKPAYRAYGECNLKDLITAVDDIYAKYNELEAKYQEQCKIISEYEEDKHKTDQLMLEFQERYYDAEKQLKEVKADNEDLECQLNSNYLAKKLADEQEHRSDLEVKLNSLRDLLEEVGIKIFNGPVTAIIRETHHNISDRNWTIVLDDFDTACTKVNDKLKENLADEQQMRAMAETAAQGLREDVLKLQKENVELKERLRKAENKYVEEYHNHLEKHRKLESLRDLLEIEGIHTFPKGHIVTCDDTLKATNGEWTISFTCGTCTVAQLENEIEKLKYTIETILEDLETEFYIPRIHLIDSYEDRADNIIKNLHAISNKYEEQKRRNSNLAQKNAALGQHIATLCDRVHKLKKGREEHIFEPITKDTVNHAFCKFEGALGINIGPMDADVVWRANRILKGIYDLKDKSSYVQFDCPFHTNPENGI